MAPAVLQWLWLRAAIKRHRVITTAVVIGLALAAYAAPSTSALSEWKENIGWGLSIVLGVIAWRQHIKSSKKEERTEFDERVREIAKPAETHELLQSIQATVNVGFKDTNERLSDLGERVSCLEGRMLERRSGLDDRRFMGDDRRIVAQNETP